MSKVTFDVEVDSGNSPKTLKGLRDELESINEELEQVEVGSKAFNDLSKQAAKASSEIKDIEKSFEGLDATQRTEAFAKGFEGIAGAVAITAGSLQLFGVESERIGKLEEKVQATIAIAIGARALAEGALNARIAARVIQEKAALVSTKALTVAQRLFNVVLSANPIGLVIAGISAAVLIFTKFGKQIREFIADRLGPLNTALDKAAKFLRRVGSALGLVASEEELALEKTKKASEERVKLLERELKLTQAKGEETIEIERQIIEEKMKLYEQDSDEYANLLVEKEVLEINYEKRLAEERAKRLEERRKEREKEYEEFKTFYRNVIKVRNDIIKENEEFLGKTLTKSITEANDAMMKDFESRIQRTTELARQGQEKTSRQSISNLQAYAELASVATKAFVESNAYQTTQELAATANSFFSDLLETQDQSNEEGFEKSKKYKIAQVLTTSTQAAFDAFAGAQKYNAVVPGLGTAIGIALVGAIAAKTRTSISDIRSAQFEGGGSLPTAGGGGGGSTLPTVGGGFTPIGQQAANTQLTPQFNTPTAPLRAYVIGQDVEDGREAEARLNRRRTLGGG
jgi:hypothetical protein